MKLNLDFKAPNIDKYIGITPLAILAFGGSSFKPGVLPENIAADEAYEETGLRLEPSRFSFHGARQLAGTFSTHKANVFSVALKETELQWLENQQGTIYGLDAENETGERTYVEVRTLRAILSEKLVDWSNVGMILSIIHPQFKNAAM